MMESPLDGSIMYLSRRCNEMRRDKPYQMPQSRPSTIREEEKPHLRIRDIRKMVKDGIRLGNNVYTR